MLGILLFYIHIKHDIAIHNNENKIIETVGL